MIENSFPSIRLGLILSALFLFFLLSSFTLAQVQDHPLSQVRGPFDVNINMSGVNITNVSYVFFGNNSIDTYLYRSGTNTLQTASHLVVTGGWVNSTGLNVSGTTNVSINAPTFFIDTTNSRVGIGTTSPSSPLQISAALENLLQLTQSSGSTGGLRITSGSNIGDFKVDSSDSISITASGGTNNDIRFVTGNTEKVRILGGGANAGSVGIGTTAPGNYKLNVIGDINASWGNFTDINITRTFNAPNVVSAGGWVNASNVNASNTVYGNTGVFRTLSLGWENITSRNLNIAWTGSLHANNLTGIIQNNLLSGSVYLLNSSTIDAGNITSGTLKNSLLSGSVYLLNSSVIDAGNITSGVLKNSLLSGSVYLLNSSTIAAGNITSGTISIGVLPTQIAYTNSSNIFTLRNDFQNIFNVSMDASNLTSGTVALARLSGITTAQLTSDLGLGWVNLTNYPSACASSQTITTLGDTITCTAISITESQISNLQPYLLSNNMTGRGTSGYIPQWANATALNDSNIFQLGSNVGIGTTSPVTLLDVRGNTTIGNTAAAHNLTIKSTGSHAKLALVSANVAGGPAVEFYVSTTLAGYTQVNTQTGDLELSGQPSSAADIVAFTDSDSYLVGSTSAGGDLYLAGTNSGTAGDIFLSPAGGNVGINTTSPSALLNVMTHSTDTKVAANISNYGTGNSFVVEDSAADITPFLIDNAGNVGIGTVVPGQTLAVVGTANITGGSATTQGLFVDSNGRIGLGTASPGNYKLNVIGDVNASWGNFTDINITRTFNAPNVVSAGGWVNASNVNASNTVYGNTGVFRTLDLGWANLSSYPSACASGQFVTTLGDTLTCSNALVSDNMTGRGTSGYIPQWANATALNDSNIFQLGSNVGIGTTSPSSLLHISGSASILNVSNATRTFLSVNTTKGRGADFGGVGMGTTTPMAPLHIDYGLNPSGSVDSIILDNTGGQGGGEEFRIKWLANGPTNFYNLSYIGSAFQDSVNDGYLAFGTYNSGWGERMRIDKNGNVGIRTTAPTSLLHVNGTGALLNVSNRTHSQLYVNDTGVGYVVIPQGNVGIGTASPNNELTISDGTDEFDLNAGTNQLSIQTVTTDGSDDQRILIDAGSGAGGTTRGAAIVLAGNEHSTQAGKIILQPGQSGDVSLSYGASATIGLILTSSGNIGIGTTAPNALLHVMGNATINGSLYVNNSIYQSMYGSDDGLIGYWSFSEGTGSIAYDRSPYGNDGTLTDMNTTGNGTSGWNKTACKAGWCMQFDGINDYIDVGNSSIYKFNVTDSFSISVWVNVKAGTTNRVIIGNGWTLPGYALRIKTDNAARFLIAQTGGDSKASDTAVLSTGWHHIAAVWDGVRQFPYIFVDGVNDTTYAQFGLGVNNSASQLNLYIGNVQGQSVWFDNTIDEIMIFNRTLSVDEIRTQYLRGMQSNGAITADRFRIVNTSANKIFEINRTRFEYDTSKLVVDASGNIGIGTTSPNYLLEIANNSKALNVSGVLFVNGTSGNVGIGTVSPSELLHIQKDGNVSANLHATTGSGQIVGIKLQRGGWATDNYDDWNIYNSVGVLYFDSVEQLKGTNTRLAINDQSGNVGIGTTNPQSLLHVNGTNAFLQISVNTTQLVNSASCNADAHLGRMILDGGSARLWVCSIQTSNYGWRSVTLT